MGLTALYKCTANLVKRARFASSVWSDPDVRGFKLVRFGRCVHLIACVDLQLHWFATADFAARDHASRTFAAGTSDDPGGYVGHLSGRLVELLRWCRPGTGVSP